MTRVASFVVLLGILAIIIVAFYWVMVDFLAPVFVAAFLVVIFRPTHEWIAQRIGNRLRTAAMITTTLVLLMVLLPTVVIVSVAFLEGAHLASEFNFASRDNPISRIRKAVGIDLPQANALRAVEAAFTTVGDSIHAGSDAPRVHEDLKSLTQRVRELAEEPPGDPESGVEWLDQLAARIEALSSTDAEDGEEPLDVAVQALRREFIAWKLETLGGTYRTYFTELANPSQEQLRAISSDAFSRTQPLLFRITSSTTTGAASFILGGVITVVAFYFFLCDGPKMTQTVMRLSPLDDRYEQELLDEFVQISRAVFLATILSAAVQGILAGIGYALAGIESVFLLMVFTGILALIPLVGTFGVWGPVCFWLYFVESRPVAAILLFIYCAGVVSTVDNVIKPLVLHGRSRLHPLLALLSVLGGVKALGPIGILVGPMVVVFLQTLLNILQRELSQFDQTRLKEESLEGDPHDSGLLEEGPIPIEIEVEPPSDDAGDSAASQASDDPS